MELVEKIKRTVHWETNRACTRH